MEFKLGNSIVNSYKRLSYTPWYAFAEFVDNSTQAYFNNKEALNQTYEKESKYLEVIIDYQPENDKIIISDNSFGMGEVTLQKALTVGLPPENNDGRSKYGLGMKTAAFWFGDEWRIRTTELGDKILHEVDININDIITNESGETTNLIHKKTNVSSETHFTEIEITKLNRTLKGRTLSKIREYLSSMYRMDFRNYNLKIYWQNTLLEWDDLDSKLYKTEDGKPFKQTFKFIIENEKTVSGWVGVLGKGNAGRKHAGFSIIKANRVIEGWPRGFKPNSVFGDLDDGVNDLVNQRVVGELYLDDFEVSHTKDTIIWLDNEQTEVDDMLESVCADAVHLAKTLRFKNDGVINDTVIRNEAITTLESEIKSGEFRDFLVSVQPPEEQIIKISFERFGKQSTEGRNANIDIEIGIGDSTIRVLVFFVQNSEFDPYVVIETSSEQNTVIVIINAAHPHYLEMTNSETLTNFIRHCVYDGVAEWKAIKLVGDIYPYTIKNLKDGLLRVPFNIKQNKFR
jgi:Histidine kinase-, DNA gyrase B-, and HSP90-like ATPase